MEYWPGDAPRCSIGTSPCRFPAVVAEGERLAATFFPLARIRGRRHLVPKAQFLNSTVIRTVSPTYARRGYGNPRTARSGIPGRPPYRRRPNRQNGQQHTNGENGKCVGAPAATARRILCLMAPSRGTIHVGFFRLSLFPHCLEPVAELRRSGSGRPALSAAFL